MELCRSGGASARASITPPAGYGEQKRKTKMKGYGEKLQDPRWQQKRLKILERDKWMCTATGRTDLPLAVHHRAYAGDPWEVDDDLLETVSKPVHNLIYWLSKILPAGIPYRARDLFDAAEESVRIIRTNTFAHEYTEEGVNFHHSMSVFGSMEMKHGPEFSEKIPIVEIPEVDGYKECATGKMFSMYFKFHKIKDRPSSEEWTSVFYANELAGNFRKL